MAVLYLLSFPRSPVLVVISWQSCPGSPVLAVQYWLSCPGCPAVLSRHSCPGCPEMAVLSWQPFPDDPFWEIMTVFFFWLSCPVCPGCPVLSVLSWLFFPSSSVLTVPSWLFYPGCPVVAVLLDNLVRYHIYSKSCHTTKKNCVSEHLLKSTTSCICISSAMAVSTETFCERSNGRRSKIKSIFYTVSFLFCRSLC